MRPWHKFSRQEDFLLLRKFFFHGRSKVLHTSAGGKQLGQQGRKKASFRTGSAKDTGDLDKLDGSLGGVHCEECLRIWGLSRVGVKKEVKVEASRCVQDWLNIDKQATNFVPTHQGFGRVLCIFVHDQR